MFAHETTTELMTAEASYNSIYVYVCMYKSIYIGYRITIIHAHDSCRIIDDDEIHYAF